MLDENRYKMRFIDGLLYDPWSPSGPVPTPETVAYALANLCRYGGHVTRRYTVAEHSIWVALHLACGGSDNDAFRTAANSIAAGNEKEAFCATPPERARLALCGLCHDCPEGAGLVDVPGPVGRREEMREYQKAHERVIKWLCDGWGISGYDECHAQVKAVDIAVLGAELAIRPVGATGHDGSGEDIPRWPGLDLAVEHDLSLYGHKYLQRAWSSAYHVLHKLMMQGENR